MVEEGQQHFLLTQARFCRLEEKWTAVKQKLSKKLERGYVKAGLCDWY